MADDDSVRQRIISSVFTKLNSAGHEESYVAHIKIWEEAAQDEGGKKPRYILLSQASNGGAFIHKSKLNSNGSFSVGKSWKLQELRGIEVVNPLAFKITMARTYRWQTEVQKDQANFISALVKLFRGTVGVSAPLQLAGVPDPDGPSSSRPPPSFTRMERAPTPTNGTPLRPASPRRPIAANGHTETVTRSKRDSEMSAQVSTQPPSSAVLGSSRPRRSQTPTRVGSPESSSRVPPSAPVPERPGTPVRARSSTSSAQQSAIPSALRPGRLGGRRPSNASSNIRTSASSSNLVPSIVVPTSPPPTRPTVQTSQINVPSAPRVNGSAAIASVVDALTASSSSAHMQPSPVSSYAPTPEALRQIPLPTDPSALAPRGPLSRAPSRTPTESGQARREQNARVSFFDPPNQAALNQLLSGDVMIHDYKDGEGEGAGLVEGEDETALATLESMEEMLEGYEWASDDILERRSVTGAADQIEARLLDELMALDRANVHSFIESDDRVQTVLKYLDESLKELDGMDSTISSYKIYLNNVNEDITYIQSQNRGLQVQIQNQRALLSELEELLQTVHVDKEVMLILTQESLEKSTSIQRIEGAATELYKALQASRDRDMAATMERLEEYRTHNAQFCKRLLDYLTIMFTAQANLLLGDTSGIGKNDKGRPNLLTHNSMETYLGRYGGLLLYMKEMEESIYAKLCAAYFSAASTLHGAQVRALMAAGNSLVKKTPDEDADGFGVTSPTNSKAVAGIRRAGTIVRSPLEGRRDRKEQTDGDMRASEVFGLILEQVALAIHREEEFIADFLQINDAGLTFADYMGLENYFRRQAVRFSGLSPSTAKLVRGAMDLIFGFLPAEFKTWLDGALNRDKLQIIGMIVSLERSLVDAEERGNAFLLNLLEKQHVRLKAIFSGRVNEHIKSIEETKLTSKKRNGVAPFIKFFPTYIGRVETQLIGADTLEIRQNVDMGYERIVQSMFDALKHMAKMDGEGEDKGQLNYHVILIENMHHFVAEISQIQIGSVAAFLKRAEAIYDENLSAYVKIVLRRPFAKIIDYFEGIERLLKTTAPSEVASNSNYSKASLKKVIKDYNAKDVRKYIDALFKRVEKHFTEASEKATTEEVTASTGITSGTVMVGVWKACEEELLRITEVFSKRIAQCYKDMGVGLEYSAADVEAAFKRHRVGA